MPVPPPDPMPARRTDRPLPAHRHLPGEPVQCVFEPVADFAYGCDLFDARYYWEAHEVWEAVWVAAGRRGPAADFLKGLIKLAAAGVKCREGNQPGLRRHARRAHELFSAARQAVRSDRYFGLRFEELLRFSDVAASATPLPAIDGRPQVVFSFRLLPQ